MILNNMLSSMVDAALEEREGHLTVVLEDVREPLLETAAVLHEVGNVATGEGVVQHLQEDVVQEGEEVALHQVPDHRAQEVEDVVDGLPKVASSNKVVQVNGNVIKVCSNVHFRDLGKYEISRKNCHLNKALSVDQDSCFCVEGNTKELKNKFICEILNNFLPQGT